MHERALTVFPFCSRLCSPVKCTCQKTILWDGIIVWVVNLDGETIGEPKKRHVNADMRLSNCGVVFDDSYISAEPIR